MTLVLVTAPTASPVLIEDLKEHLRVDHSDEDAIITGYAAAAVAHLDGWTGVLGRCIMPQTWKITGFQGDMILPMPDVTSASAEYEAGATILTVTPTAAGPCVTLDEDAEVTFTCEMPPHLLPTAVQIINLMVGDAYENREAAGPTSMTVHPAITSRIDAIKWRHI